jgi:hypothetical protein
MKTTLTITQANCLARGRARVTASTLSRRLWQADGGVQTHEPMTPGSRGGLSPAWQGVEQP